MSRCVECGLLAIRRKDTRQLIEAESAYRENGFISGWNGMLFGPREPEPGDFIEMRPVCFVLAFDLSKETTNESKAETCRVLQLDRDCKSFTTWKQGFSPREHLEMIQLEELRKQQREEAERNREFQAKQASVQRRHQWLTLAVSLCGVAVAAYSALMAKAPAQPPVVNVLLSAGDEKIKTPLPAPEPSRRPAALPATQE